MRIPALGRVGIVLVLSGLAVLACARYWLSSRTFIALDTPISLSPGHTTTQEFTLNLNGGYRVQLELAQARGKELGCYVFGCSDSPSILNVQWTLSADGTMIARGSSQDVNGAGGSYYTVVRDVGRFAAPNGTYKLDVDVLADAGILNPLEPRLRVEAGGDAYNGASRVYEICLFVSGALVMIGIILLIRARIAHAPENSTPAEIRGEPDSSNRTARFRKSCKPTAMVSGLPPFGLVATVVWCAGLIPVWLMNSAHRPASGLWVTISVPVQQETTPWTKPLVVRIDKKSHFFVNGNPVQARDLRSAVKGELNLRADRVVYLDADIELAFSQPAFVIDVIQGLYAKTVLVTPNSQRIAAAHRR